MNGVIEWAIFLSLSAIAVSAAAGMILTMSMYRAGLSLMASFVALAGLFIFIGFYNFLRSLAAGSVSIVAPIFRLKGYYRYHFQLQSPSAGTLHQVLRAVLPSVRPPSGVEYTLDVDPFQML